LERSDNPRLERWRHKERKRVGCAEKESRKLAKFIGKHLEKRNLEKKGGVVGEDPK